MTTEALPDGVTLAEGIDIFQILPDDCLLPSGFPAVLPGWYVRRNLPHLSHLCFQAAEFLTRDGEWVGPTDEEEVQVFPTREAAASAMNEAMEEEANA